MIVKSLKPTSFFLTFFLLVACSSDSDPDANSAGGAGATGGSSSNAGAAGFAAAGQAGASGTAGFAGSAGWFAGASGVSGASGASGNGGLGGSGGTGGSGATGGSGGSGAVDAGDTIEGAIPLEPLGDGWSMGGVIDPLDTDIDFYSFYGKQGDWILVHANVYRPSDISEYDSPYLDPVLRLYTGDGTQFAFSDDYFPRTDGQDSIIYTRLPYTGTYYAAVSSYCGLTGMQGCGSTINEYSLDLYVRGELTALDEIEPNDSDETAQALTWESDPVSQQYFGTEVLAEFSQESDIDVYRFQLPVEPPDGDNGKGQLVGITFDYSGQEGNGSSAEVGLVSVWRATESANAPFSQADARDLFAYSGAPNYSGATLVVDAKWGEQFWFEVRRAPGSSDNDFYHFTVWYQAILDKENEPSSEHLNDTIDSAEILANPISTTVFAYRWYGELGDNDTDYFKANLPATTSVDVRCSAEVRGSAIRGLAMELFKADGTALVSTPLTETSYKGAAKTLPFSTIGGTELIISLKSTQPNGVGVPWYSCVVYALM